MQLKGKKICIVTTILVYCSTFLLQSNLVFFQAWAQEKNIPRVNIVTVLVDDKIYNSISSDVQWYASNYIQSKLSETKALVIPLDLDNISAYDIYRMMENIYFDGLEDVNSSLIGLVMIGNIPLPVVSQNGYEFPTVYPYVDFENQKYVWDEASQYFVSNGNPGGQAEIWHGLIDYGTNLQAYHDYFEKIKKYQEKPDEYIGSGLWYEDFIAQEEGFLDENYQYYKNHILFSEDIGYQRFSPLMRKMFVNDSMDNAFDILSDIPGAISTDEAQASMSELKSHQNSDGNGYTAKTVQQEIQDTYLADYNDLFSSINLSTMRENALAGGRWIKQYEDMDGQQVQVADVDNSASKIQLKDTLYLGNENLEGLIENWNDLLEEMVDKKIEEEKYDMDIVIPVSHDKITTKKVWFKKHDLLERWENYYFGKYALYIDDPKELSIYRGTYRNLNNLSGVTFDSLNNGYNPPVSSQDKTNTKLKSIGASYDIFSTQVEGNRGYTMLKMNEDLDTYDEKKQAAKWFKNGWRKFWGTLGVKLGGVKEMTWNTECDDKKNGECESLSEFAQRWWGGASAMNLETGSLEEGRYTLSGYVATNSWRPIYDMGGFQALLVGEDEGASGTGWVDGKGTGPQTAALSFKSFLKYASPTKVNSWEKMGAGYIYYTNKNSDEHEPVFEENYWDLNDISSSSFEKQSDNVFQVKHNQDTYVYKFLSSVIKHVSTSVDEINGIDYDKYGESGNLGRYFADISKGYSDVDNNVKEALLSGTQYSTNISGYREDLNTKKDQLAELINSTSKYIEEIKKLNSEITSVNESSSSLKETYTFCVNQCEGGTECNCVDPSDKISGNDSTVAGKQKEIQNLSGEVNSRIDKINSIIKEISAITVNLKDNLLNMYGNIIALSPDCINLVLNHIIYSEGGDPEDYQGNPTSDLKKIQMLGEWKNVIMNSKSNIEINYGENVELYKQAIRDTKNYQGLWNDIEKMLNGIKDDGWDEIKDSDVNKLISEIFIFKFEGKDENGQIVNDEITLDEQSLSNTKEIFGDEEDPAFDEYFKKINTVFNNLVENDDKGDQVIELAKSNKIFTAWLLAQQHDGEYDRSQFMKLAKDYANGDNRMSYTYNAIIQKFGNPFPNLSSADIITLFSKWAKGDGYDEIQDPEQLELISSVTEHLSGMNILTPDRPIDSPRYVSMQSVAGNEINLIYPDLFKVEAFDLVDSKDEYDVHNIKLLERTSEDSPDKETFRESLERYLSGKVVEYNTILQNERKKAKTSDIYFQKLAQFDIQATPTLDSSIRPYGEFTYEDFYNALGGDTGLNVIAEVLYYQNLTNISKLSSEDVSSDIEKIAEGFSINEKRKYVLEKYLMHKTEEEKQEMEKITFVTPSYNMTGYEVAFVNSNGGDYIIPGENSSFGTQMNEEDISKDYNKRETPDLQETELNDECNIPSDGKVPLFALDGFQVSSPWVEAFNCWRRKTLEEPFKLKLSFDNSLGSAYIGSGLKEFVKGYGKEVTDDLSETFVTWKQAMGDNFNPWDTILEKQEDPYSTQSINQLYVDAEQRNQSDNVSAGLNKNIKLNNSNSQLSEINPSSELKISSLSKLGNIKVSITSTGDSCLAVDGKAVCGGSSINRTFNSNNEPLIINVTTSDHKAGISALDLKFSVGGGVLEKVVQYNVSPGFIDRIELTGGDVKSVAGIVTPFEASAFDKYGNKVDWSFEDYEFIVDKGRFLKDGSYQTGFTTKDFKNLKFKYQAPLDAQDNDEAIIHVLKKGVEEGSTVTYRQTLIQGKEEVKLNNAIILKGDETSVDQTLRLTASETIYNADGSAVDVSKLQKLDIDIKDSKGKLIDIDSQVLVHSQNGLVKIGSVDTRDGKTRFVETVLNSLMTGHVTVYYYPTKVAGDDVITIEIPGLEPRTINLSILPAAPETVEMKMNREFLYVDSTAEIEIKLMDHRGNLVDGNYIFTVNDYECEKELVQFLPGIFKACEPHAYSINNGYGSFNIYGLKAGKTMLLGGINSQIVDTINVNVDGILFPQEKLNIMYLNYFGNDWGNQWGYLSDNNKYIENLMINSEKIITTTTQLVSEDKIKQVLWKLSPGFKISNLDNISTKLSINKGKINMLIGDITEMKSDFSSIQWIQVASQSNLLEILPKLSTSNYVIFIPDGENYSIKDGILYDGTESIVNVGGGEVSLNLSDYNLSGYNLWNVTYNGTTYGYLLFYVPNFYPIVSDFDKSGERYLVDVAFTNGSTANLSSVGIFDGQSDFELISSYKSIQDSKIVSEKIGFLGDFKNITLFAEGENVGESTRKFGSEFVINLGDPVLSRKSSNTVVYGSKFDSGIGREIFTDAENDIFGSYPIDFNKDGIQDLLVIYLDGTIKLSKNYGGNPNLREMQELMRIAVGIEGAYVGDVDGNGYDDILIRTKNNQLRAYLNNKGIFDVDGKIVCLNAGVLAGITSQPSSLDGVYQLFVEDMDRDGKVDIITNDDKGKIKVFYGGSNKGGGNYLSTEKYACDTGWYERQESSTVTVDSFGLNVTSDRVYDNSMIRWVGLTNPKNPEPIKEEDLKKFGITINADDYTDKNIGKLIKSNQGNKGDSDMSAAVKGITDEFDVDKASVKFTEDYARYHDVTLYESDLIGGTSQNYTFIPISFLDAAEYQDPVTVYKTYSTSKQGILVDGDKVTVTVVIQANKPFVGTFGDVVQGPWRIYYDDANIFQGIEFISNQGSAEIKPKDGNFAYLIDKIALGAGQTLKYKYTLEYNSTQLRDIDVTYETFYSSDDYPDIKVKGIDGCVKDFDVYINGGKGFTKMVVPLQSMIDEYYEKVMEDTHDYDEDVANLGTQINNLPGIIGDRLDRVRLLDSNVVTVSDDEGGKEILKGLVKEALTEGSLSFNVDLKVFEDELDKIEGIVDDITKGMCNGFDFGGSNTCKGLPVPFNQAFLAPGKYHLFGCWNLPLGKLEQGLPVFFFPGTLHAGPYEVPIPDGLKSPLDSFMWVGGGIPLYTSWIRIYAAPTLTNQLGLAICLGNEKIAKAVPSPLSDVAGNCIVIAVKPQCNKDAGGEKLDSENPNPTYENWTEEVRDSGTCTQSMKGIQSNKYNQRTSPFNFGSYSANIQFNEVILTEQEARDIVDDLEKLFPKKDLESKWENFLKKRTSKVLTLGLINDLLKIESWDVWAEKMYNKHVAGSRLTVANPQNAGIDYSVNILGGINMEIDPVIGADEDSVAMQNSITIAGIDVLGGDFDVNKIRGGLQQGVRKLLIDKWLDPQIRYIMNQLTKMHVSVIFPNIYDFDLGQWGELVTDEKDVVSTVKENIKDISKSGVSDLVGDLNDSWNSLVESKNIAGNGIKNGIEVLKSDKKIGGKITDLSSSHTNTMKQFMDSGFSYQYLNNLNKDLANPFESLAGLLNQSNILNISMETLTVKVPMIFAEDINSYDVYLRQWVKENTKIMEEWKDVVNSLGASCSKLEESEQSECYENAQATLAGFVEFEGTDRQKTLDQINRNIMILQEYRNFPFEIYDWIHVIDRYMGEIASLINDTIGYLSYWLQTNSGRFVGYVDAITLIMNIIKTYQMIIDFSVDWSAKCGNCAEDTYDQYSCKLSLLCDAIELPIIQIPNFKIPNITLDLSNIDLGLDIILPEFNFQPVRIDLPDIPNLPEPPSISAHFKLFDLPDIPELPEPPELPELPSFIPEVELELPILPPAPELPKIPNEIEGIINIASKIGKIYCIVKKQFGLVGESSVKAKIEQLTQRTYEVPWIDRIMDFTNLSAAPVKNYGVDYEISTYVDFQFNFDDVYRIFDSMTTSINNLSTDVVDKTVNSFSADVSKKLQEVVDKSVLSDVECSVNMDGSLSMNDNQIDIDGLTSDQIEYSDYTSAKNRLQDVLTYFAETSSNSSFKDKYKESVKKIENQINKTAEISPNQEGLQEIQDSALAYLDSKKSGYEGLAEMINDDYDGFLAMVDDQSINNDNVKGNSDSNKQLTFNLQLFELDSATKETIGNIKSENPYKDLLENKQNIIDGYRNAINTSTADSLGLSSSQYLVLRNQIANAKKEIGGLYSVVKPAQSTTLLAKNGVDSKGKTLVASNSVDLGNSTTQTIAIDPAGYAKGIYDTILTSDGDERKTKIVSSDTFVDLIGGQYYFSKRIIGKGLKNIILWNEKAVYLKSEAESDARGGGFEGESYVSETLKEIPYEEKWISLGKGMKLKIADENIEVKNRKVQGQTFDNLSFSWTPSKGNEVDGYLIKMVEKVDYSFEKADYTDNSVLPRYVLVVPNSVDSSIMANEDVKLEILKKTDSIQKLMDGGELVEIVHYDPNKSNINVTISEIDRKWMYSRIATLNELDGTYYINSPRSNQIVAGRQIVGDDQGPSALPQLYRNQTKEVVSEGDDLQGYVGTWYTLNVDWKDNVALSYVNLSQNGQILMEEYTSMPSVTLSWPLTLQTKQGKESFTSVAIDQFGNKSEKVITVSYNIPDITITDVSRDKINSELAVITAELSQDIDEGNVTFQRKRGESWKTLLDIYNKSDFDLAPRLKTVQGIYSAGEGIALYGSDGESLIAVMDPDTGEIKVQDEYKDKVQLSTSVYDSAIISVIDKETSKVLFEISLPTEQVVKVVAEKYSVSELASDGNMGMYNGGYMVHKDGNAVLLVSPTGHLYSDLGLQGGYSYDRELQAIKFELYEPTDEKKMNPIYVWVRVQPYKL